MSGYNMHTHLDGAIESTFRYWTLSSNLDVRKALFNIQYF